MQFHLFMYCTIGRRAELEAGMAGQRPELYQRMLDEIAEYARFADEAGFAGFGHPEHHLQVEGFEISNEPGLMAMWIGQHSKRLRINTVGWVAPTHNPVRTAEYVATLDHMLKGRLGVGFVRGHGAPSMGELEAACRGPQPTRSRRTARHGAPSRPRSRRGKQISS